MAYEYINNTGMIVPNIDDTLTETQTDYKSVFGNDLDLTPSTPQGLLISADTITKDEIAKLNADLANQFNPNLAGGIFLDAICALMGLDRTVATRTIVTATIVGDEGTIIPAGSQAETTEGNIFESITEVEIPVIGSIDTIFQSVETGAIPCPAGSLTTIIDNVLGWTEITNTNAGDLGVGKQSDLSLRNLRRRTLAIQGVQTNEAIMSALYNINDVQSLQYRENYEATTQVIDGISMIPHSIYICVNGGTDDEVAQTILSNRSAGSGFNGDTVVPTTGISGQIIDVKFDRPAIIQVLSKITVKLSSGASGDIINQIKQKILDYANGDIDGEDGFMVGLSVSAFELITALNGLIGVYVVNSEIALASDGIWQNNEIPIAINEIAVISESGITVVMI